MTHYNFNTYVITTGLVLAGLLFSHTANSDQTGDFFDQGSALYDSDLSSQRGQSNQVTKDSTLLSTATVSGNTITVGSGASLINGNNVITGQAFSNSSGIETIIQNSGNNVVIQNQTVVNVSFQ